VSRPQDWDIMLKMGFIGHHYGIESTNHKSLKAVGKGMDPEKLLTKLLDAKQYFRKHGSYKGQISLIAGLPFETHETLEKTLKWTRDNWSTENTLLFPLYIPLENGGDAKSKLSIDWKKWGYKQSSIDYKDIIKKEYLGSRVNTQYGVGDGLIEDYIGMSWENSEWNILDVYKIVSDFYQPDVYNQFNGPVIWGMGEWQTVLKKPFEFFLDKTINQVVKDFNTNNGWIVMREGSFNMVRDYVNKKLNWKQK
jgi:hypothetical protein